MFLSVSIHYILCLTENGGTLLQNNQVTNYLILSITHQNNNMVPVSPLISLIWQTLQQI